jgi:hypothetical protein
VLLLLGFSVAHPAAAVEPVSETAADSESPGERHEPMVVPENSTPPGKDPGLDALLQLPSSFVGQVGPAVAGASEAEWRRRFRTSRETLSAARKALEKTKQELDGAAEGGSGNTWSVAPPTGGGSGGGPPNSSTSPLSFKLRQDLKRNRTELDAAEKASRELEIEADLAGVPVEWRGRDEAIEEGSPELGQLLD